MATVYSKSHLIQIEFSPAAYGATNLTWNHQHKATVNTAELLAALDAVPRDAEAQLIAEREELKDYARAADSERDELAATIERVRKWAHDWRNEAGAEAFRELDAALDPKPAFVLPTEAGVSFTAKNGIGEEVTFCSVWNITTVGPAILYVNNQDYLYNGDDVLKIFTHHRLLNAALNEEGNNRG